jgi:hypothetical protein
MDRLVEYRYLIMRLLRDLEALTNRSRRSEVETFACSMSSATAIF